MLNYSVAELRINNNIENNFLIMPQTDQSSFLSLFVKQFAA